MKKQVIFLSLIVAMIGLAGAHAAIVATNCSLGSTYESCNAGYYLSGGRCSICPANTYKATSGSGDCTPCPILDSVTGQTSGTSASNHDSVTDCYIPTNSTFTDASGTYEMTTDCYYQ